MHRRQIVVTRTQVSLCDYLRQQFFEDKEVEVLLDRRCGQRRRSVQVRERERRRADRRQESSREADLRPHGFVVILPKPEAVGLGEIEKLLGELQEQIGKRESFPQGNGLWKRRSPGAVTREELPPPLRTTAVEQSEVFVSQTMGRSAWPGGSS